MRSRLRGTGGRRSGADRQGGATLVASCGGLATLFLVWALALGDRPRLAVASGSALPDDGSSGCLVCHAGIEDMHPEAGLSCVDCHGGDATANQKHRAHPRKPAQTGDDERVPDLERDLVWRRFVNPMDLRITDRTCAPCHEQDVDHLLFSLHGTTAGHLSDGYFEMGLTPAPGSNYSIFPVAPSVRREGEVDKLIQVPEYFDHAPRDELSTHYTDLARKECMQCHLYSQGRAVRGRVGFDGDYRGSGCAACHVHYELDGLTRSKDRTIPRGEPGHPRTHTMTKAPTTQTCTTCHYGDASIGLHFRGLSQLPPGAPGGPEIPGTTDTLLNRTFYLNDPDLTPPDVHHERGMHCIDCHTKGDVMGDGQLHGQMEYAVETSCSGCHGTFEDVTDLKTERGTPLEHLRWDGDHVILTSKVDGREHVVPQVVHVLDPRRPEFNPRALKAMTKEHAAIECYTCHAGWNVNFLGFHFTRNESLSQLDLLSGKRTPGRVTTQEKVFASWKSFYAGLNEAGRVAPYMTGFSTMGSVWDENGELILDQVMPETKRGLSGMTMIHHQVHTTRPTARSCVECHRSSATWGMGSANFQLARQLAFVADRRGIEVVALSRGELANSAPLAKFPLPDVVDLVVETDHIQGHARYLYALEGGRGIHVLDVSDPVHPKRVAFRASINPRGLELAGGYLYLADGIGGLKIFDVANPERMRLVGHLPTFDAHDVDVQWPWAYVADGPGGLAIVDVRAPIAPAFVTAVDINGPSQAANEAIVATSMFQYSRPKSVGGVPVDKRTVARNLCAVLDRARGPVLIDVTEPGRPQILFPSQREMSRSRSRTESYRGMALLSQVDLADSTGGERTFEKDYLYVLVERTVNGNQRSQVGLLDITEPSPEKIQLKSTINAGFATEQLVTADFYSPPFRQRVVFTPGERGVYLSDVSTSREPQAVGTLPGIDEAFAVAIEAFPLDRMIDEEGQRLKDISHGDSRWLYRTEVERILTVPEELLETDRQYPEQPEIYGMTARLHLEKLDADHSGLLEGEEYAQAGGAGVDGNNDGRISLHELARHIGMQGTPRPPAPVVAEPLLAERISPDGDLARLLDGTDPFAADANKNGGLERKEAARAVFAALDLDRSGKLSQDELSRYPGAMRQLRYGDARAREMFLEIDGARGDGHISRREFRLGDEEWRALDADEDGRVRLVAGRFEFERDRAIVAPGSEWPARRSRIVPVPPNITIDKLFAEFDRDGDDRISNKELKRRRELFQLLDRNRDSFLERDEVGRTLQDLEVDVLPDDFLGRWDLDGDGVVEAHELPPGVALRLADSLRKS